MEFKCTDCGINIELIKGKEIYHCPRCKSTFRKEENKLINCGFKAYQIKWGEPVYLCEQCKYSFKNEAGKFIKCPKCENGLFVARDGEEVKRIDNNNQTKRNEKNIVQPDYNIDDLTASTKNLKPKKATYSGVTIATIVAFLFLAIVVIGGIWDSISSNTNSFQQEQTNYTSPSASSKNYVPVINEKKDHDAPDNIGAYVISQNFVKDNIISPATADFPIEPTNVKCIGNKFIVASYLDAQNSYGAKVRKKYICCQIYNGGEWSHQANWTLEVLFVGDEIAYVDKSKTEQEIANDMDYFRTH